LCLALIVLFYFSIFDLGIGRAVTKFVAESLARDNANEISGLIWASLGMQLLLGVVGGLVLAAATPLLVGRILHIAPQLVDESKATFLLLAASLPIVLGTAGLQGVLAARQRFDLVNAVQIPLHAATFLIPAIGSSFGSGLPEIVSLLLVARLLAGVVCLIFCLRVFPYLKQGPSLKFKLLRPLVAYGSWVAIANVVGPVFVYLDRSLIGAMLSVTAVGYYTAPYQLATAFWILPTSLVATLFPAFSTFSADSDRSVLEKLYASSLKLLVIAMGPLVLLVIVLAPHILLLWLGADFAEQSSLALRILALGVLVNSLGWVPFYLLQALGRPDLTAKFYLLELPLYVAGVWFLLKEMGIAGVALAWTLRAGLDTALLFAACSVLKLAPIRALARNGVGRSTAVLAALGVMLAITVHAKAGVLIQGLLVSLAVVLFAIAAWRYALDGSERNFLRSTASQLAGTTMGRG
jgi:O-antigen/teichoic acid export membrane protein